MTEETGDAGAGAPEPAPESSSTSPGRRYRGGPPWRGGPPPWWPESEPWPPRGREGWQGVPRHFARRIALFLLALFGLAFLAGGFLFWIGSAVWHGQNQPHHWTGGPPFGFAIALVIIALVVIAARGARRTARPIDEVMGAAERVASGDYSARVQPGGPREVRSLARSFNAMAERLEANERVRRQLFADVAHELRTPLTIISANIEGILDGVYTADAGHLEPALEETRVMSRLLEDISMLAMAESGALRLRLEPMDARDLAEDAVAAHAPEAAAAGVSLTVGPGAPAGDVEVDPVRIREVLSNLIANAIRHTPRGGSVTVGVGVEPSGSTSGTASTQPGGVRFSVADTGTGIPADRLGSVFDRFAKSPESRGAGLGLAIAKSLVEAHGGTIGARNRGSSADGDEGGSGGAEFWFVIPRTPGTGSRQGR
jgi:signal transduction histidine kinase